MYVDEAKNPIRSFLGLIPLENKNIKAWPKQGVLMKKKSVMYKLTYFSYNILYS